MVWNKRPVDVTQLISDYLQGASIDDLAAKHSLHRTSIWRRLDDAGVEIRSREEQIRGRPAHNRRGWYIQKGYRVVLLDKSDPFLCMADQGRHIREHRIVMARHLGRVIPPSEDVHHINGNKLDNRIENLEVLTKSEHGREHMPHERAVRMGCMTKRSRAVIAAAKKGQP